MSLTSRSPIRPFLTWIPATRRRSMTCGRQPCGSTTSSIKQESGATPRPAGGRGLHIYVPLAAGYTFERVRSWVKAVGQQLATTYPELIAIAHGPTHRGGRVTIDYAQNSVGRNTAAPYTLRAGTAHPTVSTPLTWAELAAGTIHPADLTPQVVLERVGRRGDLFAPALQTDQHIT
jgi:bifunctional non-homologous end joining protein LigD